MDRSTEIRNKVEASLTSLDDIRKAEAGPSFVTRVMARLQRERKTWEKVTAFIARPAVAASVIGLVIAMNTWAVLQQREPAPAFAEQPEQSIYDDQANLAARSYYDYENVEP